MLSDLENGVASIAKSIQDTIGFDLSSYRSQPTADAAFVYLRQLAEDAGVIVAAWGANGTHRGRDADVRKLLPSLHCLALTQGGHPGHPLYLKKTLTPFPMGSNVKLRGCALLRSPA